MPLHDDCGAQMKAPKVLGLVGDMDGCALWRILLPFTELQRQGFSTVQWGNKDDDRLGAIAHKFEAIILPRLHWPPEEDANAQRWFNALHRAGLAIIYELDDDLLSDHFVKRMIELHGKSADEAHLRQSSILTTISRCDGVTVSNYRLATLLRSKVDIPIAVVPNFIDLRWFKRLQKKAERKVPGLTIGWAGGIRPDRDVEPMAVAWGRIARRYPEVTFVLQGHQPQVIYDNIPHERLATLEWLPIESYPIGLVNIDIACCPLADDPFNRCKTPIKAMEFAASGAAIVASPLLYDKIVDNGENGYIAETVDEWEVALSQLIEDYTHRRQMAKALLAKVRQYHSLEKNAWRWLAAWSNLIHDAGQRKAPHILLPKGVSYAHAKAR